MAAKIRLHSDDWYKGYAEGFNRGIDCMDLALGRNPGKPLKWKVAKALMEAEGRKGALTRSKS